MPSIEIILFTLLIIAVALGASLFLAAYNGSKKVGRPPDDYQSFERVEPHPPISSPIAEPMVPQALVNQILEDTKAEHNRLLDQVVRDTRAEAEEWKRDEEKRIRADAIKRHKNVIKGKTTEHLVPYMDDFKYNPSDCRFLGSPIDIIVFDGLSDGQVTGIAFLEIKTGKSASLSTRERQVRDAIKGGHVSWRLIRKKD